MTAKKAVMQVKKKKNNLREFCCLNSSCIRKSITLMFVSSSKNIDTHAFVAKFANRNFRFRDFLGGLEFFLFGEEAGGRGVRYSKKSEDSW